MSIRLVASVSCFELTESTELKKAAEADLHDAPQTLMYLLVTRQ